MLEQEPIFETNKNENIISQLWSKYYPYWPFFMLLCLLSLGSAWLYIYFKIPMYESNATLLIKDEKKGTEESKMIESLNLLSSKKIIENEIEVIKSRTLVNQVVNKLQLYASIYEIVKLKVLPAYSTSPVKIEVQNPDSIHETKKIEFKYDTLNNEIKINDQILHLNKWYKTPWGKLRFSINNPNYSYTGSFYFILEHPKRVTQNLINNLEISMAGKLSSVVNLNIKDAVPQRSENFLNALIKEYENAAINEKKSLATNTLSFLDDRLLYITADLDSIEKKLQEYRSSKGAIDISSQGKEFLKNVSTNDQKLSEVNMKLIVLKKIEQYLLSNDKSGVLVPSTLNIDDPLLTNLLNKLYDAELQYEKLKKTTGQNNPELSSLADQIEKLKPSILENIRSQKNSIETNKNILSINNSSYTSLIKDLPQQERDLVEISREQSIKSSIYSFLLQKREEAALSHSKTEPDSRIIDKAESSIEPVGISNKYLYLIAGIFALGLGIVLITTRDLLSRNILFRQEIEAITSLPVIGEIENNNLKNSLVIEDGKSSYIAEQFRMLRTSLRFFSIQSKCKKILITSTIPGEGKSFIALNLAMSLSLSGKKVILVEYDLSNPTLSVKLGIEETIGIADYLSSFYEIEEVIQKLDVNDNCYIITAGTLPSNPSELNLNDRTEKLLKYLDNYFDFVIIDSAPVGILSDGYILSRYCDATIYVVRHRHTPKKMLERLEYNNRINELKNIGIVFNGVRTRGFSRNSYGYGYSYIYKDKKRKK